MFGDDFAAHLHGGPKVDLLVSNERNRECPGDEQIDARQNQEETNPRQQRGHKRGEEEMKEAVAESAKLCFDGGFFAANFLKEIKEQAAFERAEDVQRQDRGNRAGIMARGTSF